MTLALLQVRLNARRFIDFDAMRFTLSTTIPLLK